MAFPVMEKITVVGSKGFTGVAEMMNCALPPSTTEPGKANTVTVGGVTGNGTGVGFGVAVGMGVGVGAGGGIGVKAGIAFAKVTDALQFCTRSSTARNETKPFCMPVSPTSTY